MPRLSSGAYYYVWEAFGIPAAASAQATAPPIAVAKSAARPDSKYILHSSAAEPALGVSLLRHLRVHILGSFLS